MGLEVGHDLAPRHLQRASAQLRAAAPNRLERVMHFNADKSVLFTYDQALRLGWDKKYSRPEEPRPITRVM